MLSTVLMAAFTTRGVVAEGMVTRAVGRRVESAERVDTAVIAGGIVRGSLQRRRWVVAC